jgi:hypothetical protein
MSIETSRIRSDDIAMLKKIGIPIVITVFLLSSLAAWGLAPGNPDIFVQVSPTSQDVSAGGSGAFSVTVISQEGFEDNVELTAADLPAGVIVTFDPNPVDVPAFGQGVTQMTVNAAADAPTGTITVTFTAQGVTQTDIEQSKDVTVNIAAGGGSQPPSGGSQPPSGGSQPPSGGSQPPSGGVPTTTTVTTTLTTTVVQSTTTTETTITTATSTTQITMGPPSDPMLANAALLFTILAAIIVIVAALVAIMRRR